MVAKSGNEAMLESLTMVGMYRGVIRKSMVSERWCEKRMSQQQRSKWLIRVRRRLQVPGVSFLTLKNGVSTRKKDSGHDPIFEGSEVMLTPD